MRERGLDNYMGFFQILFIRGPVSILPVIVIREDSLLQERFMCWDEDGRQRIYTTSEEELSKSKYLDKVLQIDVGSKER